MFLGGVGRNRCPRSDSCISGSGGPGRSWVVPLEPSRRPGGDGGGGGVRGPPTPSLRAFLCARRGSAGVRGVPAAEGGPWDWETVLGWWGSRPRPSRTPLGRVAAFQGGLGGVLGGPRGEGARGSAPSAAGRRGGSNGTSHDLQGFPEAELGPFPPWGSARHQGVLRPCPGRGGCPSSAWRLGRLGGVLWSFPRKIPRSSVGFFPSP